MQGKWRNGELSVLLNLLFYCTHQTFINHRRSASPWTIMHIFASFIKVSCFLHSRNGLQMAFHMWQASRFSWTLFYFYQSLAWVLLDLFCWLNLATLNCLLCCCI
jgi:hypothetical protein